MRVIARRPMRHQLSSVERSLPVAEIVRFIRLGVAAGAFDQAEDVAEALEQVDLWEEEWRQANGRAPQ